MRFGLCGFPGSGKTTLFNAMTGLDVPVGYGGEVRVGTVRVPDPRVDFLSRVYSPKKTTHATINLRDVPGEHGGVPQVLSPRSLQEIRDRDALCLVLRDFVNPALEGDPDPPGDLQAFHEECVLADLAVVERRLDRARKERADVREIDAFETMAAALGEGKALRLLSEAELHRGFLKGFGLLSDQPLLAAVNVEEERAGEELDPLLAGEVAGMGGAAMVLSASVEAEIAQLDPEDQAEFLEDMGLAEPVPAGNGGAGRGRTGPQRHGTRLMPASSAPRTTSWTWCRSSPSAPRTCTRGRSGGERWRAPRPATPDRSTATWNAASSAPRSSRSRCSPSTGRSRR